jgi:hypothetical protein
MDYKDTLFLPQTQFPMRADLTQNEPKRYKKWFDQNAYETMKQKRKGAPRWTFHDGPPYANGSIHIGHALNKILKDIVVKFYYFQGYDTRFTAGWDCHGLPIEQQVETALGREQKERTSKTEIRRLCRERAKKYVEIQKEGFKSLGVIADWNAPYITMDYKFEAETYRELARVAKAGLLVERKKPVYWSWAANSALAEAEVEYQDKESDSIFVAFALTAESCKRLGVKSAKAVIWTTTPWTLPANTAIALRAKAAYALTEDGYIVAKERYETLINEETGTPVRFEKAVLFSPGVAITGAAKAVLLLNPILKDTSIVESRSPAAYRAQRGASLGAYKALFNLEERFDNSVSVFNNIDTLVFIESADELISLNELERKIKRFDLSRWRIHKVSTSGSKLTPSYHHLIIDSTCVSEDMWRIMSEALAEHLSVH